MLADDSDASLLPRLQVQLRSVDTLPLFYVFEFSSIEVHSLRLAVMLLCVFER